MCVCVSSNRSIADLEKLIKKFKDIKNKKVTPPNIGGPAPYGALQCQRVIRMTTNSDPELRVIWSLPYYGDKIRKMNLKYFLELFGNQGPKSIISYLKKNGLATSLEARKKSIADMTKFELVIGLTS